MLLCIFERPEYQGCRALTFALGRLSGLLSGYIISQSLMSHSYNAICHGKSDAYESVCI